MSLTAGEVINHARDLHAALSPANAPAVLGYRALSRIQRDLLTDVVMANPAYLATQAKVAMPLADFNDGIDLNGVLGEWADLVEIFGRWATASNFELRVWSIPWEQRDLAQRWPSFTLRNNTVYLMGTETGWSQIAELRLTYSAVPLDLTSDSSVFALHDDARETLAASLAAFYLGRLVGNPEYQVGLDASTASDARATETRSQWMRRIIMVTQRQSWQIRDVR